MHCSEFLDFPHCVGSVGSTSDDRIILTSVRHIFDSTLTIITKPRTLFNKHYTFSPSNRIRFVIAEVARTRLREEGSKYRSFWQTLHAVYQSEGRRGLYRGLATQLIRQIPNTAIMMSTYELTVYVLTKWLKDPQQSISHNSSTS